MPNSSKLSFKFPFILGKKLEYALLFMSPLGYFFNAKTQVFPIVSYQYIGKPGSELVLEAYRYDKHGFTFQAITIYGFSKKKICKLPLFMQLMI
jgi:hypothetical protein